MKTQHEFWRRTAGAVSSERPTGGPMRLAIALTFSLSFFSGACVEDTEYRIAAEAALDEASLTVQVQNITASFVEIAATTPIQPTPEARAEVLASSMSELLNCGTVSAEEDTVSVTMDEEGCALHGRTLTGGVAIDVGGEPDAAMFTWNDLSNGGVIITGTTDASWAAGDEREIIYTGVVSLSDDSSAPYRIGATRTHSATSDGTLVEGSRCAVLDSEDINCWTDEGSAACAESEIECRTVESIGTELTWTGPIPEQGVHRVTLTSSSQERFVELTYVRETETTVQVTADARNVGAEEIGSSFSFEVVFP